MNKILIVANGIFGKEPGLGGGDVRFLKLATYWQKKGIEVELLSSQYAQKILTTYSLEMKLHSIPTQLDDTKRFSFIVRAFQSLFLPRSLSDFNKGIVYSVNDSLFDVLPAVLLKLRNPKYIRWAAVVHWLPPFPPWKRKKSALINSLLFFINERLSIVLIKLFADAIFPISQMTARQLNKVHAPPEKIFPVKCGVDYDKIRKIATDVRQKKYDAVFMKRVQPVKGTFDLVEIWEKVVRYKKNAKLLVISEIGPDANTIIEIIRKKKLTHSITFAGYIFDFERKIQLLAQSKMFIIPSYEENWAISVGEAMAAGIPVIAYDLPELIDVWKDNAFWIPLGNTEMFSHQIIQLIQKKNYTDKTIRALSFVKKLDWKDIADHELNVISRLR